MPLRTLTITAIISILVIIGIYELNLRLSADHRVLTISPNQVWVGSVDLDHDSNIDVDGILNGTDAILLLDYHNLLFHQLIEQTTGQSPLVGIRQFEIANYDSNKDGIINLEDPIFRYLNVLIFNSDNQGYVIRQPSQVGIRGINIEQNDNYQAIMSDGTTRKLYEINQPGGTSIYKNTEGTSITHIPAAQPM